MTERSNQTAHEGDDESGTDECAGVLSVLE